MGSKQMEMRQINTDLFLTSSTAVDIAISGLEQGREYLFALVCSDTARNPNLGQMWCQQDGNGNCQLQKIMEDTEPPQFLTDFHMYNCLGESFNFADNINENAVTYFIAYKSTLVPSDITATDIILGIRLLIVQQTYNQAKMLSPMFCWEI